jgi:hypothetical protein
MNIVEMGPLKYWFQSSTPHAGDDPDETDPPELPVLGRWLGNTWCRLCQWMRANTFAPSWLPARLRHPALGYLAAVMAEVIAVALTLLLNEGHTHVQYARDVDDSGSGIGGAELGW